MIGGCQTPIMGRWTSLLGVREQMPVMRNFAAGQPFRVPRVCVR